MKPAKSNTPTVRRPSGKSAPTRASTQARRPQASRWDWSQLEERTLLSHGHLSNMSATADLNDNGSDSSAVGPSPDGWSIVHDE